MLYTKHDNRRALILLLIISVLFCYDFVPYLSNQIPIAILKGISFAFVFCLYLLYNLFYTNKYQIMRHNSAWQLLWLFLFLMSLRVIYDFVINQTFLFLYQSSFTVVFMLVNIFILPTLFFYRNPAQIQTKKISLTIGFILFCCLLISARSILQGNGVVEDSSGRYSAYEGVDVIYYGHMGASLFIVGTFIVMCYKKALYILIASVFMLLGGVSAAFSGERGPFVALVFCFLLILLIKYYRHKFLFRYLLFLICFVLIIPELLSLFDDYLHSMGITSLTKIVGFVNNIGEEGGSNERMEIWKQGFDYFLQNPILGYSYLLPNGSYVHNIFIEQFLALGFLGGGLFIWLNVVVIRIGWKMSRKNSEYSILFALFCQYMIYGFFSKMLIAIPQYWLMMIVILSVYDYERKRINISGNSHL